MSYGIYTCGFVLTCMQTEEFEMHASTKIIVVTGLQLSYMPGDNGFISQSYTTFPFNYLR